MNNLFIESEYEQQLLTDVKEFYQGFLDFDKSKLQEDTINAHFYKQFYKRIKKYGEIITDVPLNEVFFLSIKNHKKIFSKSWYPEDSPDNFGRLIVSKKVGYDKKLLPSGTYLKQDLLTSFVDANQAINVSIPDRWNIAEKDIKNDPYAHFYGETISDDLIENRNKLRFYFNFNPLSNDILNSLQLCLNSILLKLNRRKIPFHLKVIKNLKSFYADSIVLYVERRYIVMVLDVIEEIHPKIVDTLREESPMFTYRLKKGIGFAEGINPTYNDESFGQRVTDLIYQICDIFKTDNCRVEDITIAKITNVLKELEHCKLLLFLNEKSRFEYQFSIIDFLHTTRISTNDHDDLDRIIRFGYSICKEAIWDNKGRCTWIGEFDKNICKPLTISYSDGLSGILLYLTEIYTLTNKPLFKRCATGLVKTILAKIKKENHDNKWGFHYGIISVLYVLKKAKQVFVLNDLFDTKVSISKRIINKLSIDNNTPLDVYGGIAGTLWGLILLKELENTNQYDGKIKELKDNIIARNEWESDRYMFEKNSNFTGFICTLEKEKVPKKSTGFAHGISGIAYVLSLYIKHFPRDSGIIKAKIEEAIKTEKILRRFKHNDLQKEVWLELCMPDGEKKSQPSLHWERGVGGVSYSRIGLGKSTGFSDSLKEDIIAEFEYCTKRQNRPIGNAILITEKGTIDYMIECCKLSLISKEEIVDLIQPYLDAFEEDSFVPKNASGSFVQPGLIGSSGVGMAMLRLYSLSSGSQPVNSYILPS